MASAATPDDPMIGAIEAGGTKIVCAVGRSGLEVRDAEKFIDPTSTPGETTMLVREWFQHTHHTTPQSAYGVASFSPLDASNSTIAKTTPKLAPSLRATLE